MKAGIIQSNFLPWRGYFDFIREVDVFVFHDDLQYTKGDWRNRNRIRTPTGLEWITVPVKNGSVNQRIDETRIDYSTPWARKMLNRIHANYRTAPYFESVFEELSPLLTEPAGSISDLNVRLIQWGCRRLGIDTPLRFSAEFEPQGAKTERLAGILRRLHATQYLSGPAAKAYLDPDLLQRSGIELIYKTYDYAPYPQLYGPFDGGASILDLFFMTGDEARYWLEPASELAMAA